MADETKSAVTPSSETQAQTLQTPPATGDAGQQSQAQGAEQQTQQKADWREILKCACVEATDILHELLDETDSKELLKHNKLQGLVGEMARRQAQSQLPSLVQNEVNRILNERKTQELIEKIDSQPLEALKEVKQNLQSGLEQRKAEEPWTEIDRVLSERLLALPDDLRAPFMTKTYPGTMAEGRKAFLAELIEAEAEVASRAKYQGALKKERDEAFEAGRKAALAEQGRNESVPALGSGNPIKAGVVTQAEWDNNKNDAAWRRANKDRWNAALASGAIK